MRIVPVPVLLDNYAYLVVADSGVAAVVDPSEASPVGGNTVTNINFTNNKFSRRAANCVGNFGVWFYRSSWTPYFGGPTDGWHRSGNVVIETGESVDAGNPHVNGVLCS